MLTEHSYITFIEHVSEHARHLGGHKHHHFYDFPLLIAVGYFLIYL